MQRPVGYASGVPNATVCAFTQVKRIMKINEHHRVSLGIMWHVLTELFGTMVAVRHSHLGILGRVGGGRYLGPLCVEIRQPGILRATEQLLDAATVQKPLINCHSSSANAGHLDRPSEARARTHHHHRARPRSRARRSPSNHRGTPRPGTPAHADNRRVTCSGAPLILPPRSLLQDRRRQVFQRC